MCAKTSPRRSFMAACPVRDMTYTFRNWSPELTSITSRYRPASQPSAGMPAGASRIPLAGSSRRSRAPGGRSEAGSGSTISSRPVLMIQAGAISAAKTGITRKSVSATCHL